MCADPFRVASVIETFSRVNIESAEKMSAIESAGKMAITPEQFAVLASADPKIHKSELFELFSNMRRPYGKEPDKDHRKKKKVDHMKIESFDDDDADDG